MASLSLYEVLGISSSATCHDIKTAYRRLARTCHPDVVAVNKKEWSACEFKKIHEAYSTLSDPDKRATYDRCFYGRSAGRLFTSSASGASMAAAAASSMSSFSGFTTSNKWETDQCW